MRPLPAAGALLCGLLCLTSLAGTTACGRDIDVRRQGAAGDGLQDDLPAVRRAVAAAAEAGPGTVRFPPGTYLWEGTLRIQRDDVTLLGEPGAVVQAASGTQRLLVAENVRGFRLQGLSFQGVPGGTSGITVQLRGCADCQVVGCRFDDIGSSAIDVTDGSTRCRIARNQIRYSAGHGIMISGWASPTDPSRGSSHIECHDNEIYHPGNTGISVEVRNRHVSVRGNRISGANRNRMPFSYGIAVFNGTVDYEIVDNLVVGTEPVPGTDDTGDAVLIGQGENREPARRGRIAGNLLLSNGHLGGPGAPDCPRDFCEGNGILVAFPDAGPTGIDTVIEGNLILDSGRSGISLAQAQGVMVRDNLILGSHNQGLWLRHSAGANSVVANLAEHSANHGIRIDSSSNLVAGNRSRANGLSGIYLGPEAHDNRVSGNLARGNDRAGFGHAGLFLACDAERGASRNLLEDNSFDPESGRATQSHDLGIAGPGCRDNVVAGPLPAPERRRDSGTGTGGDPPPGMPAAGLPPAGGAAPCPAVPATTILEVGACRSVRLSGRGPVRSLHPCGDQERGRPLHLACVEDGTRFVEGEDLFLSAPFTCRAGDTLTLACESGRWRELDRRVGAGGTGPEG